MQIINRIFSYPGIFNLKQGYSKRYIIPILFLSVLIVSSCQDDPVTTASTVKPHSEYYAGYYKGAVIYFNDTCSYDFAVNFVNSLDSVDIINTYMGTIFVMESNYYTVEYWKKYFCEDPEVKYVYCIDLVSSIKIYVATKGNESFEEEKNKFKSNEEITLIEAVKEENYIWLDMPEELYISWKSPVLS